MAEANRNTPETAFYAKLSPAELVARAIEMATEIKEDASISCSVALSVEQLTENPDNLHASHIVAGALADRMANRSQNQRLINCLHVLADKIGADVDAMMN